MWALRDPPGVAERWCRRLPSSSSRRSTPHHGGFLRLNDLQGPGPDFAGLLSQRGSADGIAEFNGRLINIWLHAQPNPRLGSTPAPS